MHITTVIEPSAVLRRADRFFASPSGNQSSADGQSTVGLPGPAKEVIACSVVMVALAAIAVGLRTYCRAFLIRRLGKDDWAIIIALIFSLGNSTGMSLQADAVLGRHMADLTKEEVILFFKEAYFTMICYQAGLAWAKIAILLLYLRLFGPAYPTLRKTSYAYLVLVTLAGLWLVCCIIFFCWPIEASWDVSIKSTCLPRRMRWFLGPSLNIVTDLLIFTLPLPAIFKMHLPRPQKLAVCAAFATGFVVCIISFIRLKVVIDTEHSKDPSYENPGIAKWSIVELNLAIISPCIVTLRPLGSPVRWNRSTAVSGTCETPGDGSDLTTGGSNARESRSSWFRSRSIPQNSRPVVTATPTTTSDPATSNEEAEKGDARLRTNDVELGMMGPNR